MEKFFNPGSVAIVGASARNLGHHVILNLKNGFKGHIFPVNPGYEELEGLTCYPSIDAIQDPIDLVIILVPAPIVPKVIQVCADKGVRHVIIESAGFSESGDTGQALQTQCVAIAKQVGMRLWGPNCMGMVDVKHQHFFTFMHPLIRKEVADAGRISLVVQSGMMSAAFLAEVGRRGIGVSKACSIGNRCDVNECDVLEYLLEDPHTGVIGLYLESLPNGRRLERLCRQSRKPIVLLLGGRSAAGAQAAKSHTSSLAGNSRLATTVLEMAGVIMADEVYQMMDIAHALTMLPKINPACRAAIMTLSGGAGILACDALDRHGMPVAALSERSKKMLTEIFPPWMPVANPVDLFPALGRTDRTTAFKTTLAALLEDENVDIIFSHFVVGLEDGEFDLKKLRRDAEQRGKAIVFWVMGRKSMVPKFLALAHDAGIFTFSDANRGAECLQAAARISAYGDLREQMADPAGPGGGVTASGPELNGDQKIWDEFDSKRLLADWKIPTVTEAIVADETQATTWARENGFPVVLKGLIPAQTHKTEMGLVMPGINDPTALETAFQTVSRRMDGRGRFLIQQHVQADFELMAGFLRDRQFGACVMFGLGGILAELEPDVVFATAPLTHEKALHLMRRIRGRRLLTGFRGMAPLDQDAMADILVHLGDLARACPQIEQIDINPVLVKNGTPVAVDSSLVLVDVTEDKE